MNCNFSVTFIKSLNPSSIKPCLNILFNLNVVLFYSVSDSAATRQKHSWLHNIQRRSSIFTEYNRHNRIWGHQSTGYNSGMKEGHFLFSRDLNEGFGSTSVRRDYIVFKYSPSGFRRLIKWRAWWKNLVTTNSDFNNLRLKREPWNAFSYLKHILLMKNLYWVFKCATK